VRTTLKIRYLRRGHPLVVGLVLAGCYESELLPWPEVGPPGTDAGLHDARLPRDGGQDGATHDTLPPGPDRGRPADGAVDASPDAGRLDGARPDAIELDAGALDAGALDAARLDAGALDAARLDGGGMDAVALDRAVPDVAAPDVAAPDAAVPDAALPDAALPDAALPDAALPDEPLPPCPTFAAGRALGNVAHPAVIEASGVAESWRTPGVLWMHNDSGDTARVFAVRATGEALATFELDGARPTDWEDMAVGPGPEAGRSYVYLGDVGDNLLARANIRLRRFPEPEVPAVAPPPTVRVAGVETFTLVYPDGAHNCETLLVDPRTADVFVVAKSNDGISPIYRAPAPLTADRDNRLERVGVLTFGPPPLRGNTLTTGGSIARAGDAILIKTYSSAFLWRRGARASVAEALATEACPLPLAAERQGEAIGFAVDGRGYYTVSEGAAQPIFFYPRQ
jgi:hypothetical protein